MKLHGHLEGIGPFSQMQSVLENMRDSQKQIWSLLKISLVTILHCTGPMAVAVDSNGKRITSSRSDNLIQEKKFGM